MVRKSAWSYILGGTGEKGLSLMRRRLAAELTPSTVMDLGVAYLWLQRYELASEHYQHAIQTYRWTVDSFYQMNGIAKWCLKEPEAAVQQFQLGLRATYTEGAGGVSSALLLFAVSTLRPDVLPRKDAEQFLTKKIHSKSHFAKNWPSHLGKFMLGLVDEQTLHEECDKRDSRNWATGFYKDILALANGHISENQLRERMRKRGTISHPEAAELRRVLSILWKPEFFIARHEGYRPKNRRKAPG